MFKTPPIEFLKKIPLLSLFLCLLPWTCWGEGERSGFSALEELKAGNERFLTGRRLFPHCDKKRLLEGANGQKPMAIVLTCSDSRVPPEHIFDQGFGDIFTIRIAGNVADTDEIATMEYGVEHLHIPLLLVMGHTRCGAVTAALAGGHLEGSLPGLLDNLAPVVDGVEAKTGSLTNEKKLQIAIVDNVWQTISDLLKNSPLLSRAVRDGQLMVIGSLYDIIEGKSTILGPHPKLTEILSVSAPTSHPGIASGSHQADKPATEHHLETEIAPGTTGHF